MSVRRGMTKSRDAWGRAMYDFFRGVRKPSFIERDDGYLDLDAGMEHYFSGFERWGEPEQAAIGYCHGRVLDIGCGGGRHSLHLQNKGFEVVGIDVSPLAIKTCKLRGIRHARVLPIDHITRAVGTFDTLVMLGNNFGLFGSKARAKRLLKRFHSLTSATACIVAECLDPYRTTAEHHLRYHRRNRARGRMAGQVRIRARYENAATPWLDYLFVSADEMRAILKNTGWRIRRILKTGGPTYYAIIGKEARKIE